MLHQPEGAMSSRASRNTTGRKITWILSTGTDFFFPSADTSHALKTALLTSSATSVKAHSQSSHAKKKRKTLFQCPKDLAPVKDIHLTLTVGLWQLEDVVLKSRAGRGWSGKEKVWLSREILCFPYPESM